MIFTKSLPIAMALALVAGGALAQAKPAAAPATAPAAASAPETPEAMFQRMDKNNDKMLTLDEFKAGVEARERAVLVARLQAQFKAMDKNKNNSLEPTEFYELPLVKSSGSSAPTFTEADSNKDQKLDFKEYVMMVSKFAASHKPAAKP